MIFPCAAVKTVPVILPVTLPTMFAVIGLLAKNLEFVWSHSNRGVVPEDQAPKVIPAPFAAELVVAFLPTTIFKSATSNVVLFKVVVVPLTVKLPPTVTLPVVVNVAESM